VLAGEARRPPQDLPAGFSAVIDRSLQKDKQHRYGNVWDLARDLSLLRAG
jgi:hypothetical protein